MEHSRSQKGSRMLQHRQSNSRSPALVQSRTSKRIVQHQNSQSSLIYTSQPNR
jgi:ribosomal protein L39E